MVNSMKIERLTQLAINDSGFIFDPTTGQAYNSNPIGVEIINSLKEGMDIQQIVDLFESEYEVSKNELEVDVMDFVQSLKSYFLV